VNLARILDLTPSYLDPIENDAETTEKRFRLDALQGERGGRRGAALHLKRLTERDKVFMQMVSRNWNKILYFHKLTDRNVGIFYIVFVEAA
jgi:hypothetical protein